MVMTHFLLHEDTLWHADLIHFFIICSCFFRAPFQRTFLKGSKRRSMPKKNDLECLLIGPRLGLLIGPLPGFADWTSPFGTASLRISGPQRAPKGPKGPEGPLGPKGPKGPLVPLAPWTSWPLAPLGPVGFARNRKS